MHFREFHMGTQNHTPFVALPQLQVAPFWLAGSRSVVEAHEL